MNKEQIIKDMMNTLGEANQQYTELGVTAIYNKWAETKLGLIEQLRRSPYWNEDEMAIITDVAVESKIDYEKFAKTMDELFYTWWTANKTYLGEPSIDTHMWDVSNKIKGFFGANEGLLTQDTINNILEVLNDDEKELFIVGKKESKILNALLTKWGLPDALGTKDNGHGKTVSVYDGIFAKLADTLNILEQRRQMALSVHPCDYLNMSKGKGGWRSCHNIADGGYKAGTLSYMLDSCSAVMYTVDDDVKEKYHDAGKINRQMYMIDKGTVLSSRIYPNPQETELADKFRNKVLGLIKVCNSLTGDWETVDSYCNSQYYTSIRNSKHYRDYTYQQYNGKISQDSSVDASHLNIGDVGLCTITGEPLDGYNSNSLHKDVYVCAHCGKIHERRNMYNLYDDDGVQRMYCNECVARCYDCGGYIKLFDDNNGAVVHDGRYYCKKCREQHEITCEVCGSMEWDADMYRISGSTKYVCKDCFATHGDKYAKCEFCDRIERVKRITYIQRPKEDTRRVMCHKCDTSLLRNYINNPYVADTYTDADI